MTTQRLVLVESDRPCWVCYVNTCFVWSGAAEMLDVDGGEICCLAGLNPKAYDQTTLFISLFEYPLLLLHTHTHNEAP